MSNSKREKAVHLALGFASLCCLSVCSVSAQANNYDNWYPSSIALPQGVNYHCALTPLPRDLKGIPKADRRYINHVYAMILKCAQAKTIMCHDLRDPKKAKNGYSKYYYSTRDALVKISQEPTPKGLTGFRNSVIKAVRLQMTFFDKASKQAQKNVPYNQLMTIPEGRQASKLLFSAWGKMTRRYPAWNRATKNSIYHHLCALDLF